MKLSILFLLFFVITNAYGQTGTVKGRVVDRRTKQPIPGVYVDVKWPWYPEVFERTTDSDGNYLVTGVTPGFDTLQFGASQYRPVDVPVVVNPDSESIVNVELEYGGFTVYVSMVCPPEEPCTYSEPFVNQRGTFTIAGTMREKKSDAVVPFAILGANFTDTDSDDVTRKDMCATVTADSLGRFYLTKLNPGDYKFWARRSRLGIPTDSTFFSAIADTVYRIDFHLENNR